MSEMPTGGGGMPGATGYVGMAGQAIGDTIQLIGAMEARRAMYNTFLDEMRRQRRYANQAYGYFYPNVTGMGVEQARKDMGAGAANRRSAYSAMEAVPLSVHQTDQPYAGLDAAYANLIAEPQSRLGSYGDWAQNALLRNLVAERGIGQVTNFAGGTSSVYPYRAYDAEHRGDQLRQIGQFITTLTNMGQGGMNFINRAQAKSPPPKRPPPQYYGYGPYAGEGLTGNQWRAYMAGYGPVSASYADTIVGSSRYTPVPDWGTGGGMWANMFGGGQ